MVFCGEAMVGTEELMRLVKALVSLLRTTHELSVSNINFQGDSMPILRPETGSFARR